MAGVHRPDLPRRGGTGHPEQAPATPAPRDRRRRAACRKRLRVGGDGAGSTPGGRMAGPAGVPEPHGRPGRAGRAPAAPCCPSRTRQHRLRRMAMSGQLMSIRDASLFVDVVGDGYPLVLMHGGPGADHWSMQAFRPCAGRYTVVFYDHRGNGRSRGAPVSSMTWENLTADADALRQRLGFDRWAVLGHSFGGHVALEYALRYPDSLSHLILLDTGGDSWWSRENAAHILAGRGYRPQPVE